VIGIEDRAGICGNDDGGNYLIAEKQQALCKRFYISDEIEHPLSLRETVALLHMQAGRLFSPNCASIAGIPQGVQLARKSSEILMIRHAAFLRYS